MNFQTAIPHSLTDLRRLVRRHFWRMVLPCFAVPLLVLTVAMFIPRQYEAEALFERRNDLVMSEVAGRGAPQSFARMKQGLSSELAGAPAIQRAIEDLALIPALRPDATPLEKQRREIMKQDLTAHIQRNIRVIFEVNSNEVDRVRLVFNDQDPVRARLVVNRLVENYFTTARAQVDGMLTQAASFFEKQLRSSRDEIDMLEQRKLTFELEKRDLLPNELTGGFSRSLPEAEEREALARQGLAAAEKLVATLTAEMEALNQGVEPTIVRKRNPEIAAVEERIRDFQRRIENAIAVQKMTEKHPTVVGLRQQVAELEAYLKTLPDEVIAERIYAESPHRSRVQLALIDARAQVEKATEELRAATAAVARLRDQNDQFFPVRAEYRKIERQLEDAGRHMKFWEDNLQRIRVALAAEMGDRGINLTFLKPCDPIQRPSSPAFSQIVVIAGLLSIAAAFVWVMLAEQSDNRYDPTRPGERPLPLPTIGVVREIVPRSGMMRRLLVRVFGYPVAAACMATLLATVGYVNYTSLRLPRDIQAEMIAAERSAPIEVPANTAAHAGAAGGN